MSARSPQARPVGMLSTTEAAELAGCSARQLDYWRCSGRISAAVASRGSGHWAWWSLEQAEQVRRVVARIVWGLTVDAAWRDEDPGPVPAPP